VREAREIFGGRLLRHHRSPWPHVLSRFGGSKARGNLNFYYTIVDLVEERFRQKRARSASRSVGYAPTCERHSFRLSRTGRPATAVASVGVKSAPLDPRKLIIESLYSKRSKNAGSVLLSLPNGTSNIPIPIRGGRPTRSVGCAHLAPRYRGQSSSNVIIRWFVRLKLDVKECWNPVAS
jgi:hypothetical protein